MTPHLAGRRGRQRQSLENSLLLCCFGAVSISIHFWRKTCRKAKSFAQPVQTRKLYSWPKSGPALENVDTHLVSGAFQVALVVKDLTAGAGDARTQVQSLGQEDALKEEVTATQLFLPGKFNGRGARQATAVELQRVRHHWVPERAHKHTYLVSWIWRLQVFFFLLSRWKKENSSNIPRAYEPLEALTMRFTYWMLVSSWFYTSDEPFKLYPGVPQALVCLLGTQPVSSLNLLHRNPSPRTTTVIELAALRAAMESLNSGVVPRILPLLSKSSNPSEHSLLSADSGPLVRGPPPLWPLSRFFLFPVLLILTKNLGSGSFLPTRPHYPLPLICMSCFQFKGISISLYFPIPHPAPRAPAPAPPLCSAPGVS